MNARTNEPRTAAQVGADLLRACRTHPAETRFIDENDVAEGLALARTQGEYTLVNVLRGNAEAAFRNARLAAHNAIVAFGIAADLFGAECAVLQIAPERGV